MFVFVCLGLSLGASRDQQSNGPLRPSSCVQAGGARVMINVLPVERKNDVTNLHAVQLLTDLGPAGVRPEGRNAQSSTPNAKIVFYRSRGNESRYLSFNARSELLKSSGERASARRSILPVGISMDLSLPVQTVVVCLLKMVARYRPGSFGWMQMHRQHGTTKPK